MSSGALLSTSQVATRLKVAVRTVHRWADSGRLPVAHRMPGSTGALLFDPADVERIAVELAAKAPEVAAS